LRLRLFWILVAVVVILGGIRFATRVPEYDERVLAAQTLFVPSLRLGQRARPAARRLHLEYAPYVGYRDTLYQSRDGFRSLYVTVNQVLRSEGQRPSWFARVQTVSLQTDSLPAVGAAQRRITSVLGLPRETCLQWSHGPVRQVYWQAAHGSGVLLTHPLEWMFAPPGANAGRTNLGEATLQFGVTPFHSVELRTIPADRGGTIPCNWQPDDPAPESAPQN